MGVVELALESQQLNAVLCSRWTCKRCRYAEPKTWFKVQAVASPHRPRTCVMTTVHYPTSSTEYYK